MLKELVQFTKHVLADQSFASRSITPREGLHIVLAVEKILDRPIIDKKPVFVGLYPQKIVVEKVEEGKKKQKAFLEPISEELLQCARRGKSDASWNFSTNKLFDDGAKSIHTCSPFAFAFKRGSLELIVKYHPIRKKIKNLDDAEEVRAAMRDYLKGGQRKYDDDLAALQKEIEKMGNVVETQEKRGIIFDRVPRYFRICREKLEIPEQYKMHVDAFENFLKDKNQVTSFLESLPGFSEVHDNQYLFFYLDIDIEVYRSVHKKYVEKSIFNQANYNLQDDSGKWFGTSNYFNTFNIDKPFLTHQTAVFNIAGRVSSEDAEVTEAFSDLSKLLPNPLPLFIISGEREEMFKIYCDDESKKTYLDIIEELWNKKPREVGNYYLLYRNPLGEIRDFDFVSRFEFNLNPDGSAWEIVNLFKIKEKESKIELRYPSLANVSNLQTHVFGKALANKYRKWEGYFNDIEDKKFENLSNTLLVFRKYRKSIYDFIYKSRRQSINGQMFKEIMLAGITDDLKHGRMFALMDKLNIWLSLNHHFDPTNSNFKKFFMPNKFEELLAKTQFIADSKDQLFASDEVEFSFIAGQLIDYLLGQTEAQTPAHMMLEPFVQKGTPKLLVQEIEKSFQRYWHKLSRQGRGRFEKLMCALQAYNLEIESTKKQVEMKDLKSFVLVGYFAPSVFYEKKQKSEKQLDGTDPETTTN